MFSDRIEFISPGGLHNMVSIEKLAVGTSFSRNPFFNGKLLVFGKLLVLEVMGVFLRSGKKIPKLRLC